MASTIYTYDLGPTEVEVDRLESQHRAVFKPLTNGLLPTEIREYLASLGRAPAVADIATGTGQNSQKHHSYPLMLRLSGCDVLVPFAEDLHGQYDLVHIRLLITALNVEQWPTGRGESAVSIAPGRLSALGRGGLSRHIVPADDRAFPEAHKRRGPVRFGGRKGYNVSPPPKFQSKKRRFHSMVPRSKLSFRAPANLLEHVKSQGYTSCHQTSFSTFGKGKTIQDLAGRSLLSTLRQGLHGMVLQGGFDWVKSTKDIEDIMALLHDDLENNVCVVGFELYYIVGRQPS
ncbi:hypothetical protein NM208_g5413 [Fusarium decemcellulare]|uniref:Uncharacterized protein n=1 Tax=Fusarium decemcellulare TaxID=57161 RepID=A0ACC1SH41_9HYPO|nr:hypothetical protein NM208_g5413 [Fusarium decemcellulare]